MMLHRAVFTLVCAETHSPRGMASGSGILPPARVSGHCMTVLQLNAHRSGAFACTADHLQGAQRIRTGRPRAVREVPRTWGRVRAAGCHITLRLLAKAEPDPAAWAAHTGRSGVRIGCRTRCRPLFGGAPASGCTMTLARPAPPGFDQPSPLCRPGRASRRNYCRCSSYPQSVCA